jgi:hypothetical protein
MRSQRLAPMPPSVTRALPLAGRPRALGRSTAPPRRAGEVKRPAQLRQRSGSIARSAAPAMGRMHGIGNANQVKNDLSRFVWNAMAGSAFASWVGGM